MKIICLLFLSLILNIPYAMACIDPPYEFTIINGNAKPSTQDNEAYIVCYERAESILGTHLSQSGIPRSSQQVERLLRDPNSATEQLYAVHRNFNVITSPLSHLNGTRQHFECHVHSINKTSFVITQFMGSWENHNPPQ